MKLTMQYIRTVSFALLLLLVGGNFISCEDKLPERTADQGIYNSVREVYGYLKNYDNPRNKRTIDLRDETAVAQLYFGLTAAANKAVDVQLTLDPQICEDYNAANGTKFEVFPIEFTSLEENGAILIAPGDLKSDIVTVTLTKSDKLSNGKTYMLPFSVASVTEGVKLNEAEKSYIFYVKVLDAIPDSNKGTGIVTVCYIEVGSNNPLNAAQYTMKRSGKPFIDIVNIFAANINYDNVAGRVFVSMNPEVKHLLSNRDKYIKPLQDKGIKVCLSILGNHDQSGVANLRREVARDFAAELRAIVETYGLDGVDFDDEWSQYPNINTATEFFPWPSPELYAGLCYEVRKAMPDKIITVYCSGTSSNDNFSKPVDGMTAGEILDYSWYGMYGSFYPNTLMLGLKNSQWGPYPVRISGGGATYGDADQYRYIRERGYGVNLMYDMTGVLGTSNIDYTDAFTFQSRILYDDDVVFSGQFFRKDY